MYQHHIKDNNVLGNDEDKDVDEPEAKRVPCEELTEIIDVESL